MVRLPQHGSDVLITLNSPIFISEHSAAAEHAGGYRRARPRHATLHRCYQRQRTSSRRTSFPHAPAAAILCVGAGFKGAHLTAPSLFRQIAASFRVDDWALFGGGGGGGAA